MLGAFLRTESCAARWSWSAPVASVTLVVLLLAAPASCGAASAGAAARTPAPLAIRYPGASAGDRRVDYYLALLDLVLHKSGTPYTLAPNDAPMVGPRVWREMDQGGIDVTWGPSTREAERALLPIRIPLDKGILGWRIFLIKAGDSARFDGISSLAQLQPLAAGLQRDWGDTDILRSNGLTVMATAEYEPMFAMLAEDRFQYFPRGIGEIWGELESHPGLGLEVEQHLALHYSAWTYFFVSRKNPQLARVIEAGLRAAIKDGSFDKLFEQYNGAAVRRARLQERVVFELDNPLEPETKPDIRDLDLRSFELTFRPNKK